MSKKFSSNSGRSTNAEALFFEASSAEDVAEDVACAGHEQRLPPLEGVWNLGRQCGVLSLSDG